MRKYTPGRNTMYGIQAEDIARWCDVHITTARRWKRGEEPPLSARIVIELMTSGDLSVISSSWEGWTLSKDGLKAPTGATYSPGDIMATDYWRTLVRSYQAEQRLPRQADWVDEEWQPARDQAAAS